jgi:acyl-CoA thioesterase I
MRRLIPMLLLLSACLVMAGAQTAAPRTILIFGDSLTAGYGLDDPAAEAFPGLLQQKLNARPDANAPAGASPRWRVINAGVSGDTSAGGLRRIDWILRQPADVFILELGANDGLRGLPLDQLRANLIAIVAKVRAKNPSVRVLLAGMRMPPNLGDYAAAYDRLFPELAAGQQWALIPFLLEGVGGTPSLNQADVIHPTADGHKVVAETVWKHLFPLL